MNAAAASFLPVSLTDVRSARRRIADAAVVTPLLRNPKLDARAGGRILVKFEGSQREGSFKFRGAYNRLVQLSPEERARGVVAWSSGNHGQGIAAAAALLDIAATIVMPRDAPKVKLENARRLGAEVVLYDRISEEREAIARALVAARGSTLVPSFDDATVIAGQGTLGLEILQQARAYGLEVDQALVPCGGGGLVAGTAVALCETNPQIRVYSVEPAGFDGTARSLAAGCRLRVHSTGQSICDALLAREPGEVTFPINARYLAGGLAVTDEEVRHAMAFAFRFLKLVVEPGGAVALAAALAGKLPLAGRHTAVVVSGANVDPEMFAEIITSIRSPFD